MTRKKLTTEQMTDTNEHVSVQRLMVDTLNLCPYPEKFTNLPSVNVLYLDHLQSSGTRDFLELPLVNTSFTVTSYNNVSVPGMQIELENDWWLVHPL